MKFTLAWLKDHLATDAPLQRITDTLTAIGLELEDVHDPSRTLAPFVVAHVLVAVGDHRASAVPALVADDVNLFGQKSIGISHY